MHDVLCVWFLSSHSESYEVELDGKTYQVG
jgi:hypothetical protein